MSDPRDTRDPLEAELAAMPPAGLPPEMVDRVGRELSQRHTATRRRWVVAGAAVAASVLIAAAMWPPVNPTDRGRVPGVTVATTTQTSPGDDGTDGPALFAYRRALAGSPQELDELLDRHAARTLPAGPRVTASTRLGILP